MSSDLIVVQPTFYERENRGPPDTDPGELSKLDFSPDIIHEARQIWLELNIKNIKGNMRKKLRVFCIFVAHMKLSITQDFEYIAEKIAIDPKKAKVCFKDFSENNTGYALPLFQFTIHGFLDLYIDRLNLGSYESEIKELVSDILRRDTTESLKYEQKPQNVAAGFLVYFLRCKQEKITVKFYQKIYKKKETINTVHSDIVRISVD